MTDRRVFKLTGKDVLTFLQGMVSNDVLPLAKGPGLVWAALLTPQGKYLADFFVVNTGEMILLDIAARSGRQHRCNGLSMYRLRADVKIEPTEIASEPWRGCGTGGRPARPAPPGSGLAALCGWRG